MIDRETKRERGADILNFFLTLISGMVMRFVASFSSSFDMKSFSSDDISGL